MVHVSEELLSDGRDELILMNFDHAKLGSELMPRELTLKKKLTELMFCLTIGFVLLVIFGSSSYAFENDEVKYCKTSKEYITAVEFLKEKQKLYGLQEVQIKEIASKIITGCTGATKRFVKVIQVLTKVEVGTREAIQLAADLSNKTNDHVEVFLSVFKKSYLSNYLDLDLRNSVEMAKALSIDFKGNPKTASLDFKKITEFCVSQKELGLPLSQCASLSKQIVTLSKDFKTGIAEDFFKSYRFMVSKEGLGLSVAEAFASSVEVIQNGPHAADNFITAYKYGVSSAGLDLAAGDSLKFAKQLAGRTRSIESDKSLLSTKTDRMPSAQE